MVDLIDSSSNKTKYRSLWISKLDRFLISQGAFSVIKLHGFLTAVNSSPSIILPSQWLPLSKIQEIDFNNIKQANEIMADIMSLYNHVNTGLRERTYAPILYIPPEIEKEPLPYEKIWNEIKLNTKVWAAGYWSGVESTWPEFTEYLECNSEIHTPLSIIYCLTLSQEEFIEECKALKITEENYYKSIVDYLPNAAIEIYNFWIKKRGIYSDEFSAPIVKESNIGRNDNCICGSGKKYKKCCLH